MRFVILSLTGLLAACNMQPLQIDPCAILPDMKTCYAVPLNQPGKPEYERPLNASDICVTSDEYAKLQKYSDEVLRRCGKKCAAVQRSK